MSKGTRIGRLLEVLPDGYDLVDGRGVICHANEFFLALTRCTLDELVGQTVEILVPARSRDSHVVHRHDFAQRSIVRMRVTISISCACAKTEIVINVALAPLKRGGMPWVIVLMRDYSARRTVTQSRSEIEQRFRLAFENTRAGMILSDLQDQLLAVNNTFCQMVGRSREDLLMNDSTLRQPIVMERRSSPTCSASRDLR